MTPRPPVRASAPALLHRLTSKVLAGSGSFIQRLCRGKLESASGVTVGAVWVLTAPVFFLCAAVDFLDGGPDYFPLLVSGVIVEIAGLVVVRFSRFPSALPISRLFAAVVIGALAALIAVTFAHLATGTAIAIDVALVEATATITGTNATTVDVDSLSLGMTSFRALGQWLSAAAMIVVLVRVLPHLGVGGLDADGGVSTRSARRLAPRSGSTMARLVSLYVTLTALFAMAYLLAGMPWVDSVIHALTTLSSGGFSTRSGSIGSFQSGAIEWVAILGMLVAGTSLPLMFRAMRRADLHRFIRSIEFRVYVGMILIVVVAILAWSDEWPTLASTRHAIFATTSAISTTGYLSSDLGTVPFGGESLLLVLMVIGGMSASVAGGFKVMRFMVLGRYIGRELRRSIHPSAVEKIHLGKSSIGEVALARIIGELFLATMIILAMVLLFTADGLNFEAAFSFAISALSNVGFAFGMGRPTEHLDALGAIGHLSGALLMLIGRVSVTPLMVSLGGIGEPLQREVRRWRLTRHDKAVR